MCVNMIYLYNFIYYPSYRAGEVGYFSANIKAVDHARVGELNIYVSLINIIIFFYFFLYLHYCY